MTEKKARYRIQGTVDISEFEQFKKVKERFEEKQTYGVKQTDGAFIMALAMYWDKNN
ncbi:Uncharacterised protein [Streptococcus pneumoniae]|nr:Uncharacterised protein [Streptococcus pneumoniae]